MNKYASPFAKTSTYAQRSPFYRPAQKKSLDEEIYENERRAKLVGIDLPEQKEKWRLWDFLEIARFPITGMIYETARQYKEDKLEFKDIDDIIKAGVYGWRDRKYTEDVIDLLWPDAPKWVKAVGGAAGDIITDPATWITFGFAGGIKGTATAAKAGAKYTSKAIKLAGKLQAKPLQYSKFVSNMMGKYGGKTLSEAIQNAAITATRTTGKAGLYARIPFTKVEKLLVKGAPTELVSKALKGIAPGTAKAIEYLPSAVKKLPIAGGIYKALSPYGKIGPYRKAIDFETLRRGAAAADARVISESFRKVMGDIDDVLKSPSDELQKIIKGTRKTFDKEEKVLEYLRDFCEDFNVRYKGTKEAANHLPSQLQPAYKNLRKMYDLQWEELVKRNILTKDQYIKDYFPRYAMDKEGKIALIYVSKRGKLDPNFTKLRKFATAKLAESKGFKLQGMRDSLRIYFDQAIRAQRGYDYTSAVIKTYGTPFYKGMDLQPDFGLIKKPGFDKPPIRPPLPKELPPTGLLRASGKAVPPLDNELMQKAIKYFGETDDALQVGFITPSGKTLRVFGPGRAGHPGVINIIDPDIAGKFKTHFGAPDYFCKKTKALRTNSLENNVLSIQIYDKITPEQLDGLKSTLAGTIRSARKRGVTDPAALYIDLVEDVKNIDLNISKRLNPVTTKTPVNIPRPSLHYSIDAITVDELNDLFSPLLRKAEPPTGLLRASGKAVPAGAAKPVYKEVDGQLVLESWTKSTEPPLTPPAKAVPTPDPNFMGWAVPNEVADILNEVEKLIVEPHEFTKALRFLNKAQNEWKKQATIYSPGGGFHLRNAYSNAWTFIYADGITPKTINNYYIGRKIARNPNSLKKITLTLKGKKYTKTLQAWNRYFMRTTAHSGGFGAAELQSLTRMPELGVKGGIQKVLRPVEKGFAKAGVPWGRQTGIQIENSFRIGTTLNGIDKGLGISDAALRANHLFIDYAGATKTERSLQKLIPFWLWCRYNLTNQLEFMMADPGKYSMYTSKALRAIEWGEPDLKTAMPEWMQKSAYIVSPFGLSFGGIPLVYNPNLPFQDPHKWIDPSRYGLGALKSGVGAAFESLSPFVKLPFELQTGVSTFTKRPIAYAEETDLFPPVMTPFVAAIPNRIKQHLGIIRNEQGQWEGNAKVIYGLYNVLPILRGGEQIRGVVKPTPREYERLGSAFGAISRTAGIKLKPFDPAYYETKKKKEYLEKLQKKIQRYMEYK